MSDVEVKVFGVVKD